MPELDETDLAIIAWLAELVCVVDPPPVRLAEQVLVALDRASLAQAA